MFHRKYSKYLVVDKQFELIAILNLFLIGFMLLLLMGPFLYSPGVSLDLPSTQNLSFLHCPTHITVKDDNTFLFHGKFYDLAALEKRLYTHLINNSLTDTALLIYVSKKVTLESLLKVCDCAKSAGFTQIQLAAHSFYENLP